MRKSFIPVLAVIFAVVLGGVAMAGNTANQTVSFEVSAINELSVSGNPAALVIDSATAGSQPTFATDDSTTYAVTTNEEGRKITGAINPAMPSGVTLKIALVAPTDGTSAGSVALGVDAVDLVTGISQLAASGKLITYRLDASAAAGVIESDTRTVTLTLTAGVS